MRGWLLSVLLFAIGFGIVLLTSPDARRWLRPVAVGLKLLPARHESAPYTARIEGFVRENRNLTEPCSVLLGDSLSEGFPASAATRLGLVNRGISGDRVGDLERRLDASVLTAPCQTVMLLGGTNDIVIDGTDPKVVAGALMAIAERVKATGRRVFVLSLAPVDGAYAAAYPQVRAVNQQLAIAAPARGFGWLDLHTALARDAGGLPSPLAADGLHLGPEGYDRFTALLEQTLRPRAPVVGPTAGPRHPPPAESIGPTGQAPAR